VLSDVTWRGDAAASAAPGVHVWDVEGKRYLDFLSAYSAVNQGHCHPRLLAVLQQQVGRVHIDCLVLECCASVHTRLHRRLQPGVRHSAL
jgi:4-aminobutyrate aminotransferase-like enzyme